MRTLLASLHRVDPGVRRGTKKKRTDLHCPLLSLPLAFSTALETVPASAPFFNDHFPRRAVFPATLLLNAQIALALALAAESAHWPTAPVPLRMTHVKVRSFTPPGQVLALTAELRPPQDGVATCMLAADADGKRVATARVELGPRSHA